MHVLPLEILHQIFSLICDDGGYTGCSLSRTSKVIRAASWAARFHTVSLIAYPSRLESFTALYERACDPRLGATPRVAHLHLTIPSNSALIARGGVARVLITMPPRIERSRTPSPLSSDAESGSENDVRQDADDSHKPQRISYTPSYVAAARALVRLVAPHLETLVLQYGFAAAERDAKPLPFIDRPFPRLRELTVLGLHRLREVLVYDEEDLGGVPVLFPAVTHLHLVRKDLWMWPYDDLALLETHAPGITHLRSTCFSSLGGRLRASLALGLGSSLFEMLGASLAASLGIARDSSDDNMASGEERPAYANLRHIILQPDVAPAAAHHNVIQQSIGHLEGACRVRGVDVTVLEPGPQTYDDWSRRVRDEWKERLNGGEGCWRELGEADMETNE